MTSNAAVPAPLLSVAPMMDRTDRHFRYFVRQISGRALLYTEMVNMNALIHGDRRLHLDYTPAEHPLALQLGGDDPGKLAECARLAEEWGYDEINLNVGCPSERVQNGNFGACLMADPVRVRECLAAMGKSTRLPVTVKHRIGVDDLDSYGHLRRFVETVAESGAARFTVHARKAWLKGLSPRQNREVPPLRYDDVYRLKHEFPWLTIELNGGVRALPDIRRHLQHVDSVMIGRAAYQDPYLLATVDSEVFGEAAPVPSRAEVVRRMLPYVEVQLLAGISLNRISRHLLGLFNGRPGAKAWRRHISENSHLPGADGRLLTEALQRVPEAVAEQRPQAAEKSGRTESDVPACAEWESAARVPAETLVEA